MKQEEIRIPEDHAASAEKIPRELPVLPLRDIVVFPYMVYPVLLGRESSLRAANYAVDRDKFIFLAAQRNANIEEPGKDDIYWEGTVAKIIQIMKLPNGLMKILVDGVVQATIAAFLPNERFLEAEVEINSTSYEVTPEVDVLIRHVSTLFTEYVRLNRNIPSEVLVAFEKIQNPRRKLFYIAANIAQSVDTKQQILTLALLKDQYYALARILTAELDVLKIEKDVDMKVHESIQKSQKRFLLQEQIRILQDELGSDEVLTPELAKLSQQIEEAHMPKDVLEKAVEELNKLKKTPPQSPEFAVSRNYIDWLVAIPWYKRTDDNLDVRHVEKILNEDHYGLEKVKQRILEHIAVLNLVKEIRGQILCFVGPPGVGKTSLGKSIARALGRKIVRISLGGVRDEAEIHGHRRTYIGSMPGKLIRSMRRASVINPVILMDEIDKMSMDFRGDPASALLEVLDPEQNQTFNDHYLDVDYDLSSVMFITTANVRYNIPLPLQDRMEIIEIPGYLEFDKCEIAKRHIIPKQLEEHGLKKDEVKFADKAINKVIQQYTREAGVRNLEREIASICRKVAKDIVLGTQTNGKKSRSNRIRITDTKVEEYLGVPHFRTRIPGVQRVGSVIGLAWTSVGGTILQVDATIMSGRETLTLTGQIGEVMQESARAALSYIRSHVKELGVPANFFQKKEIHIHLPEGAIHKDGPSAGITMAMAIISAATNRPARSDVAMTGEITLRGNVLAIGGLNEKLLAAQRTGIKMVIVPKDNEKDMAEIHPKVKEGVKIIFIDKIDDALPFIFDTKKKK
ncbi:MAG: endopeptidase La [Ignavibacteriae bacterium]|nr:endopeptidase La [Ignavibacteria bacterium]MBI3365343.1 endopeptidase La [Ignavibacteriota bacterium]